MQKAIILAGGSGTRLAPMTHFINKHLLAVYDNPMIFHPLKTLVEAGLTDIMIITGHEHAGGFINLLGNGENYGCNLTYRVQQQPNGIAGALSLCKEFVGDDPFAVILGDNIFEDSIKPAVFHHDENYAQIFLKEVPDPKRFGVADIKDGEIISIIEKPREPATNFAVTGLYFYNKEVWPMIDKLEPSGRGELEITDINNNYVEFGKMKHRIIKGYWSDAGTHESLFKASEFVRSRKIKD